MLKSGLETEGDSAVAMDAAALEQSAVALEVFTSVLRTHLALAFYCLFKVRVNVVLHRSLSSAAFWSTVAVLKNFINIIEILLNFSEIPATCAASLTVSWRWFLSRKERVKSKSGTG